MEDKKEKLEKIKRIQKIKVKKRVATGIIASVIIMIIIISLFILDANVGIFGGKLVISSGEQNKVEYEDKQEEANKKQAIKVAQKKFKELGENIKDKEIEILKIQRKGELYYYISAKENTLEVRISDYKITRVNSVPVEE